MFSLSRLGPWEAFALILYKRKWLPREPPAPPQNYFSKDASPKYLLNASVISHLLHPPEQFPSGYDRSKIFVNLAGITTYWCRLGARVFPYKLRVVTSGNCTQAVKAPSPFGVQPPPNPVFLAVQQPGLKMVTELEGFDLTPIERVKPETSAYEIAKLVGRPSTGGESTMQPIQALEDLGMDAAEWRILEDAKDRGMIFLICEDFGRHWGAIIKAMKAGGR